MDNQPRFSRLTASLLWHSEYHPTMQIDPVDGNLVADLARVCDSNTAVFWLLCGWQRHSEHHLRTPIRRPFKESTYTSNLGAYATKESFPLDITFDEFDTFNSFKITSLLIRMANITTLSAKRIHLCNTFH